MFQAGVGLRWLLPVAGLAVSAFSILVYFDPVRIRRVTSFLDVEANANDSAYQLWQVCLLFGVGGLEGVGLGWGVSRCISCQAHGLYFSGDWRRARFNCHIHHLGGIFDHVFLLWA